MTGYFDVNGSARNSRYLAYCRAQGRTPKRQQKRDAKAYPGGPMAGYMVWISQKWVEFATPRNLPEPWTKFSDEFDLWLDSGGKQEVLPL